MVCSPAATWFPPGWRQHWANPRAYVPPPLLKGARLLSYYCDIVNPLIGNRHLPFPALPSVCNIEIKLDDRGASLRGDRFAPSSW